jgi:hypothetical protein
MLIPPPAPDDPPARAAVRRIFSETAEELQRRIAMHQRIFPLVWSSNDYTPAEFFEEAGTQAVKFMQIAGENVEHIAALAAIDGKTLNDFLDPSEYTPPVPYTPHPDGTITINQ